MIRADMVSTALGVQVIKNSQMEISARKWCEMYQNTASWNNHRIISLCLASAIAREFSRLVLAETEITADGDRYIAEQFKKLIPKLSVMVEQACAMGGIIVSRICQMVRSTLIQCFRKAFSLSISQKIPSQRQYFQNSLSSVRIVIQDWSIIVLTLKIGCIRSRTDVTEVVTGTLWGRCVRSQKCRNGTT